MPAIATPTITAGLLVGNDLQALVGLTLRVTHRHGQVEVGKVVFVRDAGRDLGWPVQVEMDLDRNGRNWVGLTVALAAEVVA